MRLRSGRMPRVERDVDAHLVPAGLETGIGAAGIVVAAILSARLPANLGDWRLAPVIGTLLVVGAWARHVPVVALVGLLAALVVDGFLVNRLGELSWHGVADAYRLLVMAAAAGLGLLLGALARWRHRLPPLTVPPEWTTVDGADAVDGVGRRRTAFRTNNKEAMSGG